MAKKKEQKDPMIGLLKSFIDSTKETNKIFAGLEKSLEKVEQQLECIPTREDFDKVVNSFRRDMSKYFEFLEVLQKKFLAELEQEGKLKGVDLQHEYEKELEKLRSKNAERLEKKKLRYDLVMKVIGFAFVIILTTLTANKVSEEGLDGLIIIVKSVFGL